MSYFFFVLYLLLVRSGQGLVNDQNEFSSEEEWRDETHDFIYNVLSDLVAYGDVECFLGNRHYTFFFASIAKLFTIIC